MCVRAGAVEDVVVDSVRARGRFLGCEVEGAVEFSD